MMISGGKRHVFSFISSTHGPAGPARSPFYDPLMLDGSSPLQGVAGAPPRNRPTHAAARPSSLWVSIARIYSIKIDIDRRSIAHLDIDIETLREKKRDSEGSFLRCRCVSPRRRCARLPRSGVRARAFRPRRGEGGAIAATRVHAFGLTARGYLANGDAVLGLASAEKNHADNPHVVMAMALSIVRYMHFLKLLLGLL